MDGHCDIVSTLGWIVEIEGCSWDQEACYNSLIYTHCCIQHIQRPDKNKARLHVTSCPLGIHHIGYDN